MDDRKTALDFVCPLCGAEQNRWCARRRRTSAGFLHRARQRLADDANTEAAAHAQESPQFPET